MNKRDPKAVLKAFRDQIVTDGKFYRLARQGLHLQLQDAAYSGNLAEQGFHTLYVRFETFISDLFVTYVNRDPVPYQRALYSSIESSTRERFGAFHADRLEHRPVKHLSVEKIEELIDAKGQNLTFGSADLMVQRAKLWLAPEFSVQFDGLSVDERSFIDLARLIRNAIAHRSTSSFRDMNAHLKALPVGSICGVFKRDKPVGELGSFLRSKVSDDKDRVQFADEHFATIAQKLAGA